MMTRRAPAIDAGIGPNSRAETSVAEQLTDDFKAAGLGIKHQLRAQMAKLVRSEHDASPLAQIGFDQPGNGRIRFWRAIGIHEEPFGPMTNDFWGNAVTILDQHFG